MLLVRQKLALLAIVGVVAIPPPTAGTVPHLSFITERGPALAPFAHVVFCLKHPQECVNRGDGTMIAMSPGTMALMQSVNEEVNRSILPRDDPPGTDVWDVSPTYGDCEDYAITKRKRLIDGGLPSAATRLAVALTPGGIGHVVVVERTTVGDLVLDNRTNAIEPWQDVDLTWLKIQSSANPQLWTDIAAQGQLGF